MLNKKFFLAEILNPNRSPSIADPDVQAFLGAMFSGAADGDMDIDWQAMGTGYYVHSHVYEDLPPDEKEPYLVALKADIEAWRHILGGSHMLDVVEAQLLNNQSV